MEVDPTEYVNEDDDDKSGAEKRKGQLNTMVAITVALLATFMGICGVKDNNIAQGMQQAQADKIDSYSWYQARNIREEIAKATVAQLTAESARRAVHVPAADRCLPSNRQRAGGQEKNAAGRRRQSRQDLQPTQFPRRSIRFVGRTFINSDFAFSRHRPDTKTLALCARHDPDCIRLADGSGRSLRLAHSPGRAHTNALMI